MQPETVVVSSGALTLHAQLWRPPGEGPFPAVLFSHGSYSAADPLDPADAAALGTVFARHGYVFLFLHRRGVGLSADQGTADGDLMARALATGGQPEKSRVQLELLEHEELNEALSALAFLRTLPQVDVKRIVVAGHSFGGSLTVFLTASERSLRAAVVFGGAAGSWAQSPELRAQLMSAVGRTSAAVFFIHAANDYSIAPGRALAAEMQRQGQAHRLKIYPAIGQTPRDGHNLVYRRVSVWEADVFSFLKQELNRE